MFEKLSAQSIKIVMFAQEEAKHLESPFVDTEHLLMGILKEGNSVASRLLSERGLSNDNIAEKLEARKIKNNFSRFEIQFSPTTRQAIELATDEAEKLKDNLVEPEHLLLGIVNLGEGMAISLMKDAGINLSRMRWHILRLRESNDEQQEISSPTISSLTTDLTSKIENKEINSVIGRNKLIEEIIHNLNLFKRIFPLLSGEAGVGKTSLIIGITQYLLDGKIFRELQNFRVLEFDFNNLISEVINFDEINKLFKSFLLEIRQAKDIILVIENLENVFSETMVKSGVFALFSQALRTENIYCIGVTTPDNYRNNIRDSNLNKYFQLINIPESTVLETKMFVEHWKNKISEHHNVDIAESAVETVISLAKEYYPEKPYPVCALQLLDLAASKKKFSRSIAQARIKDMERHLRILRNQRDVFLEEKNVQRLEEIKKEAQVYEEEIKILKINMSSSIRSTLTSGDVQLLIEKKTKEEEISS
jgi:ATP-dependent Clp protease ATP-binding subunit ClpC